MIYKKGLLDERFQDLDELLGNSKEATTENLQPFYNDPEHEMRIKGVTKYGKIVLWGQNLGTGERYQIIPLKENDGKKRNRRKNSLRSVKEKE
jgi:hypothetical protein